MELEIKREFSYGCWRLEAFLGDQYFGYCNLNREKNKVLFIADIKVNEKRVAPIPWWKKKLGIQGELIVFRKKGAGGSLMQEVLQIAKEEGAQKIYGYVTQDDLERSEFLLSWYERMGFEVSDPDGRQIVPAKKMVSKSV